MDHFVGLTLASGGVFLVTATATDPTTNPIIPDFSQGLTPVALLQLLLLILSIGGPIFGVMAKIQEHKKGQQTVEKNTVDLITNENKQLIARMQGMRDTEVDFWVIYGVLVKSEAGRRILAETGVLERHPLGTVLTEDGPSSNNTTTS